MNTVLYFFWQSQLQSPLHTWGVVLICRWERKWALFFFPNLFPTAQFLPNFSNQTGVNSLLDCMATFQAVLYLSDESIRSQVNHQSLKRGKQYSEIYLKRQKTSICVCLCLLIAKDHLNGPKPQHESNSYCETTGCVLYKTRRWSFSLEL